MTFHNIKLQRKIEKNSYCKKFSKKKVNKNRISDTGHTNFLFYITVVNLEEL